MNERLAQQIGIYGSPLSQRFGMLREYYGIPQRRLAQVLGISAPMLSQLSTGARIKFGNPSVFERMLLLEEFAAQGFAPEAALDQVQATTDATDTSRLTARLRHGPNGSDPGQLAAAADAVRSQVPVAEIEAALARSADLPELSRLLSTALEGHRTTA